MTRRLTIKEGPGPGRSIEIGDREVVLGRTEGDLTISDPEVSRRHAVVRAAEGMLEIEDLDSLNGTFVNDRRLTGAATLDNGDLVRVGDTTLVVEIDQAEKRAEPPPPPRPPPRQPEPAPPLTPPVPPPGPASFVPPVVRQRRRGAATRMLSGVVATFGMIVATAIALIVYFAARR